MGITYTSALVLGVGDVHLRASDAVGRCASVLPSRYVWLTESLENLRVV